MEGRRAGCRANEIPKGNGLETLIVEGSIRLCNGRSTKRLYERRPTELVCEGRPTEQL